jgi:hypothetical protein
MMGSKFHIFETYTLFMYFCLVRVRLMTKYFLSFAFLISNAGFCDNLPHVVTCGVVNSVSSRKSVFNDGFLVVKLKLEKVEFDFLLDSSANPETLRTEEEENVKLDAIYAQTNVTIRALLNDAISAKKTGNVFCYSQKDIASGAYTAYVSAVGENKSIAMNKVLGLLRK